MTHCKGDKTPSKKKPYYRKQMKVDRRCYCLKHFEILESGIILLIKLHYTCAFPRPRDKFLISSIHRILQYYPANYMSIFATTFNSNENVRSASQSDFIFQEDLPSDSYCRAETNSGVLHKIEKKPIVLTIIMYKLIIRLKHSFLGLAYTKE